MINWASLIGALIVLESGGDCSVTNGISVGCLQIQPDFVKQANYLLHKKKIKQANDPIMNSLSSYYHLSDRGDEELSRRIVHVVLLDYEIRYRELTGSCSAEDLAGIFRKGYSGYVKDKTTSFAYRKAFMKLYKD